MLDDRLEGAVLYASDQVHSWIGRAAGLLGLQPDQVRLLPSDHEFRLAPDTLAAAVAADRAAGRRPFCLVATSGTTSTGSVDPLADLAATCRAEGLWFHVDGAFGAPAILSAGGRRLLAGIEQADSLALDAHKWLFQPLEAGCVLVRDVALLESIFSTHREFLLDAAAGDREVNFTDRGLQLTRGFRAFKLCCRSRCSAWTRSPRRCSTAWTWPAMPTRCSGAAAAGRWSPRPASPWSASASPTRR